MGKHLLYHEQSWIFDKEYHLLYFLAIQDQEYWLLWYTKSIILIILLSYNYCQYVGNENRGTASNTMIEQWFIGCYHCMALNPL